MTKEENGWDEYGRRLLAPLRDAPSINPQAAAEEKQKYLQLAVQYRHSMRNTAPVAEVDFAHRIINLFTIKRPIPYTKVLVGVLVALFVIIGSSATVYASQRSLPGEPLYFIKSISEDIRLTFTGSPQAKLNLTLNYTEKRMDEISSLVSKGKSVPNKASERFDDELEDALLLASQMDDTNMHRALGQIIRNAESQGITIEELIDKLPDQAQPAIMHLRERLQEQVDLSQAGTRDPSYFRTQIRERQRHHPEQNRPRLSATPTPKLSDKPEKDKGHNGKGQPTDVPGHRDEPPGQARATQNK